MLNTILKKLGDSESSLQALSPIYKSLVFLIWKQRNVINALVKKQKADRKETAEFHNDHVKFYMEQSDQYRKKADANFTSFMNVAEQRNELIIEVSRLKEELIQAYKMQKGVSNEK